MNLNVRKEVFESLRLEFQEFTPQEFVATCWIRTLTCSHKSDKLYHSVGNTTYEHGSDHELELIAANDTEKSGMSSLVHTLAGRYGKNNGQAVSGTLWYYGTSDTDGYHVYDGDTGWISNNHS
ncbi:MAG: hypothetical protein IJL37_02685 [Bacteroidaceae bacterium]|nr:hypothetical protein [Bacteroidaceae bacterium]